MVHEKKVLKNKLITNKRDMVLIQETKLEMENLNILQKNYFKNYSYIANLAIGFVGGLMTLWKISLYELSSSVATRYSITIVLKIIGTNESICVANMYAPHGAVERI